MRRPGQSPGLQMLHISESQLPGWDANVGGGHLVKFTGVLQFITEPTYDILEVTDFFFFNGL